MADVVLCECFARDGLQHEPRFVPTAAKRALVERFAALGFARVEATSYSNPKVVPQFADASQLLKSIERKPGVFYKATCANVKAIAATLAPVADPHRRRARKYMPTSDAVNETRTAVLCARYGLCVNQ